MKEFCFIHVNAPESDVDMLFGPIEEHDVVIRFDDAMTMADLMVAAEIFPSKTQARKNGHDVPIPQGFTDQRSGKKKTRITIWNPSYLRTR